MNTGYTIYQVERTKSRRAMRGRQGQVTAPRVSAETPGHAAMRNPSWLNQQAPAWRWMPS